MAVTVETLRVEYEARIAAKAKADQDALLGMAKAMETVGTKTQATDEVLKRSSQTYGKIVNNIDGVAAATTRLERAEIAHSARVGAVMDAYRRGEVTLAKAQQDIARLNTTFEQTTKKIVDYGNAVEQRFTQAGTAVNTALTTAGATTQKFTTTTNNASHAVRQLGIQSIDVFQQLASGAPIMTTFIQQGGQIGQVMAVSNTSISSVAKSIGGMIAANAGVIAATAGMVGFGVAVYSVFQRASELEGQQRALSVAISGVGRSAELSAGQLQGYVTQLKQQGVAAAEAQAAVVALARNPGLSSGAISRIVGLAPDASAASGQSIQDTARLMSDAMKGTVDNVQKLDEAFNLLTAAEAASVRVMLEHGDKGKALEDVFAKLQARVSGLNDQALSPMEKAFREMGNAWDGFMTKVVNSGPVVAVMSQLAKDVRSISGALFGNTGAELSQEIVGVGRQIRTVEDALAAETGSGKLADARRQSMNAALAEYRAREASLIERARAEATPAAPVSAAMGGDSLSALVGSSSKSLADRAATDAGGSDAGRIAALRLRNEEYRKEQEKLGPVVDGNRALYDTYTKAIAANEKAIADLNKKNEEHRTGLEKAQDTYDIQIAAAQKLSAAYATGREAVAKITATREAEAKAISNGLTPATEKYNDEVERTAGKILELRRLEGQAKVTEQIRDANEAADAQERIAAAYDGTAESISRATNEEKAFAAVRDKFPVWTQEAADAQRRYADALNRSADASRELDQAQRSVSAIMDTLSNAADRVGQALVDAFVMGQGGAVNFGNILKGVVSSVATDFIKLAAINPLKNAAFGGSLPTLSAGLGILTGGGNAGVSGTATGGLNIMNAASNASTFGGITDALGLTSFGKQLSGIGDYLGLTGSNGLFGGVGKGISGILSTPLWGASAGIEAASAAQVAAATAPSGLLSEAAVAGNMGISSSLGSAGVTIGQLASGVGLGFGAGSLAGGFLQSSLGKVGPAPTIGAGVGSVSGALLGSIILGIGPVLGGLLGGLLGGGGGGLIGPKKATPFSATGLNATDGMLSVGQTFSQIVDVTQEVAALQQQTAQINSILAASNLRIANGFSADEFGQARIIGGNSGKWLNFGQGDGRPGSIADAFGELRFSSTESTLNRALQNKAFANLEELQSTVARITTFVNDTAPALIALGKTETTYGVGSLAATITELTRQFDDAIATARELGHEEDALTAARASAISIAEKSVNDTMDRSKMGFDLRFWQAKATNDNDPRLAFDASLVAFDARATQERDAFSAQLLGILGDAGKASTLYIDQMAQLDRVLYEERLTLLTQFNSQAVQADRSRAEQSALAVITSISDYSQSLAYSDLSPLNARDQYRSALSDFRSISEGVGTGDFNALSQLPAAANQLLTSSRGLFGSGQQYATDFASVQAVLRGAVSQSPEAIVAAAIQASEATQTAVLGSLMEQMVAKLDALLAEARLQAMRQAA
jgi:hypothetical protein